MKLRLILSALVASVLASGFAEAAPIVVYGNLGASGTNAASSNSSDIGPAPNNYVVQGFTASAPNLSVQSVSMWLFGDGSIPTTVGIYADNSGVPAASPSFTSSSVNVGVKDLYSFSFTGATLTNGASYWITPIAPAASEVTWYQTTQGIFTPPTAQNASGYAYTSTLNDSGSGWGATVQNYSLSIEATAGSAEVPEIDPAGLGSVAALIAGVAGMLERRRQRSTARSID